MSISILSSRMLRSTIQRRWLLCGSCHDKVTKWIWSNQKVKEARENPHCLQSGFSSDFFDYGTEPPTFVLGGAKVYRPKFVLRIFGEPLLTLKGAERPGGPGRITGVFYDRNGNELVRWRTTAGRDRVRIGTSKPLVRRLLFDEDMVILPWCFGLFRGSSAEFT